jgi:hypothetical protein
MYTIYPSKIRKNKSGALRIKMVEVLPLMKIGGSFDVPLEDYNGEYEYFQHTVCAIIGKNKEKDKKYTTRWNKFGDFITITRIV